MKLLIVDDEDQIREGMTYGIQWETLGIGETACCKNGKEALELLNHTFFDIVVTDISMPVLDGIELMKEVRKTNDETAFILISGYRDFEYAKAGITYGAEGYILKPVHLDELIEIVTATMKKIKTRRDDLGNRNLVDKIEKKKLLQKALDGSITEPRKIRDILQKNGMEERIYMLVCALVRAETKKEQENTYETVVARAVECLAGYSYCIYEADKQNYILIINTPDSALRLLHLQNALQRMLLGVNYSGKKDFSMGISEPGSPVKLPDLYAQTWEAYEEQWFVGRGRAMLFGAHCGRKEKSALIKNGNEQILEGIRGGDLGTLEQVLDACTRELSGCSKAFVCDFVMKNMLYLMQSLGKANMELDPKWQSYVDQSFEETIKNWKVFVLSVFEYYNESTRYTKEVYQALQYIRSHYMEKISLDGVAERLGLSAGYFGRVFKQQTGETFLKYLNRYRIDKAVELLETTNLKVYEVGEKVGITDYSYFTQLYRSVKGVSPKKRDKK